MEIVLLRCPRCRGELQREVPPDRGFVGAYCLCKNTGDVRSAYDVRMCEVSRVSLKDLVTVA
jgi:hypothetical protein